jgi:signal transduction histidine kinase
VARIESGQFEPGGDIVDIGKAVHGAVRQVDAAATAGQVSIDLTLADDLAPLHGDERQITQAVAQLLSNAVKFTDAGGSVTIKAGLTAEADVFVSVADTGIGIPEIELERAFEPFTQLDASLSRRYSGTGLGLFMARAIVTAHGGQLILTSRPGQGTTARITLPKTRIVAKSAS